MIPKETNLYLNFKKCLWVQSNDILIMFCKYMLVSSPLTTSSTQVDLKGCTVLHSHLPLFIAVQLQTMQL